MKQKVIVIGAGPAGLAAAVSLAKNPEFKVIVIEKESQVGGLSKTIDHNGNLIDIGPHRFFTKSKRVDSFWREHMESEEDFLTVRRLTRIIYLKKFFDYPINLNLKTLANLGLKRTLRIILSYFKYSIFPIKNEVSLADFYTNRFGKNLYQTFFKDYTEKVWGVPCNEIPRDWGAQRVKGLSLTKIAINFFISLVGIKKKRSETSLIEKFNYPRYGSGQLYENVARKAIKMGAEIKLCSQVNSFEFSENNKIKSVSIKNLADQRTEEILADYIISTMPIKEMVSGLKTTIPENIRNIANNLMYRDYIIVGILVNQMKIHGKTLPDNWIYVQERNVRLGRLDIFKNFSPSMLRNQELSWLGAEYFCDEHEEFFSKSDNEIKNFVSEELEKIGVAKQEILDFKVIRVKKAYPAYFGAYKNFGDLKKYLDQINNLYLIGRNGMHRYNNMDHSILTGLTAADNIINGIKNKDNLWQINTEEEYHEKK